MRKITTMLLLLTLALMTACGSLSTSNETGPANTAAGGKGDDKKSTGSRGGIALKTQQGEISFDQVEGFAATNRGGHSLQITNFLVDMSGGYEFNKVKATKDGEYRLDIIIIKEAEVGTRPVVVGEYKPQIDDMAKDNVRMANLYHFTGGREVHYQLSRNTMTGSVVITSVDEEKVTGRIDLSDGNNSIKGNFVAKPANPY
jgi:hypothetical protein